MYYKVSIYLLFFIFSCSSSLKAQWLDHRQGELIVDLVDEVDGKSWCASQPELSSFKKLSDPLNIWLLEYDHDVYHELAVDQSVRKQPQVETLQFNHFVSLRAIPNDALFGQQWQHRNVGQSGGEVNADFDTPDAWDLTTGGVTTNGDTIVVCVIDNGLDSDHEDLAPNLWINRDEIPNNGIDDDQNGFIDDVNGWNTRFDNNIIEGGSHGTSVCGIVGARGDNGIGVAGMNWRVKIMMVRNDFIAAESEVIQSYSYALEQRIAYDNTDGQEGAYVVATNASWGIDGGQPDDSPIWCSLYDQLGLRGILNIGATANENVDVDIVGDLPTSCPSEFLIGVTNLNDNDQKVTGAAFGSTSIDLGAYGEQVFTTVINNNYGNFLGTSAAAPAVTGAVALLYSLPCSSFGQLLESDPEGAARLVKEVILESATPNSSLAGITVSGGRLNVDEAMQELADLCESCLPPSSIKVNAEGPEVLISWNTIADVESVQFRYRPVGSSMPFTVIDNPTPPLDLSSEIGFCRDIEYQFTYSCGGIALQTELASFQTDGCCELPEEFTAMVFSSFAAAFEWSEVFAGQVYQIRYRPIGSQNWFEEETQGNGVLVTNLSPCTNYEAEIRTDCDTAATSFGQSIQFLTPGCGACFDAPYCTPADFSNGSEWIARVNIGNLLDQSSGPETNGYNNYGFSVQAPTLARGGQYPFTGLPGYSGTQFGEEFKVWIDFNQDGIFSSIEVAAEADADDGDPAIDVITIPDNAEVGTTRMRVIMEFNNVSSACPSTSRPGEIEDYCVEIVASPGCVPPEILSIDITDDLVSVINWSSSLAPGGEYLLRYRLVDSSDPWTEVILTGNSYSIDLSDLCDVYELQIASYCDGQAGEFNAASFNSCTSVSEPGASALWQLAPNPAADQFQILLTPDEQLDQVDVYDLTGRQIQKYQELSGNQLNVQSSGWVSGVYLIRIRSKSGLMATRRLLIR
ncbi:MAG: S8 family serine peptidase [Bacteroidota bacterium]